VATRNKILDEWLRGGEIIVKEGERIVIRKDGEFVIVINDTIIHIIPNKMIAVRMNGRWFVSRAPAWRGQAIIIIRRLRPKLPSMVPIP